MFDKLGRLIARHPLKVLLAWVAVCVGVGLTAPPWEQRCQDDDIRFLPSRCLSVKGHELLKQAFPDDVFGSKVIFAFERTEQALSDGDLRLIDRVVAGLNALRRAEPELAIGGVSSYRDLLIGSRLKSADGRCTLVVVAVDTPFLALKTGSAVTRMEQQVDALLAEHRKQEAAAGRSTRDLQMAATGAAGIGRDLNDAAYRSLDDTTIATLALVIVILLIVYRSPALALVPLVTIATSVWLSLRILALLSLIPEFQIVNITRVFIVVVLFGAGTDYCLFLISRYREEVRRGKDTGEAVRLSLGKVGWALTASAGTVVCGLGMMAFAEFAKLRYTGPAIALSLLVALLASLTMAPALLRVLGCWAFWPIKMNCPKEGAPQPEKCGEESRLWRWVSGRLAASPLAIWAISVAVLLPLAIIGWRTQYVYDFCAELPRDSKSIRGLEMIRRHFNAGEIGPMTVLLQSDKDWGSPDGRALVARLSAQLGHIANVAEVRSLTQPLGRPLPGAKQQAAAPGDTPRAVLDNLLALPNTLSDGAAKRYYVAQVGATSVTRLDLILGTEPFAAASIRTMNEIQAKVNETLAGETAMKPQLALYGITPLTHDLAEVHESDRVFINALVMLGILGILMVVVRRPILAIYLLVTVLFSYYVTIGATELMTLGWMESDFGEVDWKVPYFLFIILVAIGEDYNIFLMTRVLEESKRSGMREGTQRALVHTGGTITSCGLIMAGTFATMMLCSLNTLVQLGLALAFGVLLDTFIVRPILVPAFLLMLSPKAPPRAAPAAIPPAPPLAPPLRKVA